MDLTNGELHRADFVESSRFIRGAGRSAPPPERRAEAQDAVVAGPIRSPGWREADLPSAAVAHGGLAAPSSLLERSPPQQPAAANGSTGVQVRVLLDAGGIPRDGAEPITLEASLGRWLVPDEDRTEPGIQTCLHDGTGEFTLIAPAAGGPRRVRVTAGEVSRTAPVTSRQRRGP